MISPLTRSRLGLGCVLCSFCCSWAQLRILLHITMCPGRLRVMTLSQCRPVEASLSACRVGNETGLSRLGAVPAYKHGGSSDTATIRLGHKSPRPTTTYPRILHGNRHDHCVREAAAIIMAEVSFKETVYASTHTVTVLADEAVSP